MHVMEDNQLGAAGGNPSPSFVVFSVIVQAIGTLLKVLLCSCRAIAHEN